MQLRDTPPGEMREIAVSVAHPGNTADNVPTACGRIAVTTTVGLVTIGQSPRPDIREIYAAILSDAVQFIEAGALDGLSDGEIASLAPSEGDIPLVTLANRAEVRVGKRAITPLLQRAIDAVQNDGANIVAVLCTGRFEGLRSTVPLIEPDRVLDGFMRAILPEGHLAVVMPDDGQAPMMRAKWHGYHLSLATASPYQPPDHWDDIIAGFRSDGAQAIVLDCMGFGPSAKEYFAERSGVPVLCAQTATADLIQDFIGVPVDVRTREVQSLVMSRT
jgi:protein AroM